MIPKNHFKVLEDSENKGIEELAIEPEVSRVKEKAGFIHVPGGEFEELWGKYVFFDYLKEGLYVAENKIVLSDELREKTKTNIPWSQYDDLEYEVGDTLDDINWFEARCATEALEGKLMCPQEFFCVLRFLELSQKYDHVLEDIYQHGRGEWLDAYLKNYDQMMIKTTIYNDTVYGGYHFTLMHNNVIPGKRRFNLDDINYLHGMPKELHRNGKFSLTVPNEEDSAAIFYNLDGDTCLDVFEFPHKMHFLGASFCARLAKDVEYDDLHEKYQ